VRVRTSVLLVRIRQLRVVARPNVGGFLDSLVLLTSVLLILFSSIVPLAFSDDKNEAMDCYEEQG